MDRMNSSHWQCQVCGEPIEPEQGELVIWYRREDTGAGPDATQRTDRTSIEHLADKLEEATNPVAILRVHHRACRPAPPPDHSRRHEYRIPLSEIHSLDLWVVKVVNLSDKKWMGDFEIRRLLLFWWLHKAAPLPEV